MDEKMIEWDCPECHTRHTDFVDLFTHCAQCGLVVMIGNEDGQVWSEGWYVEMA